MEHFQLCRQPRIASQRIGHITAFPHRTARNFCDQPVLFAAGCPQKHCQHILPNRQRLVLRNGNAPRGIPRAGEGGIAVFFGETIIFCPHDCRRLPAPSGHNCRFSPFDDRGNFIVTESVRLRRAKFPQRTVIFQRRYPRIPGESRFTGGIQNFAAKCPQIRQPIEKNFAGVCFLCQPENFGGMVRLLRQRAHFHRRNERHAITGRNVHQIFAEKDDMPVGKKGNHPLLPGKSAFMRHRWQNIIGLIRRQHLRRNAIGKRIYRCQITRIRQFGNPQMSRHGNCLIRCGLGGQRRHQCVSIFRPRDDGQCCVPFGMSGEHLLQCVQSGVVGTQNVQHQSASISFAKLSSNGG